MCVTPQSNDNIEYNTIFQNIWGNNKSETKKSNYKFIWDQIN